MDEPKDRVWLLDKNIFHWFVRQMLDKSEKTEILEKKKTEEKPRKPYWIKGIKKATDRNRTDDLVITNRERDIL